MIYLALNICFFFIKIAKENGLFIEKFNNLATFRVCYGHFGKMF